MDRKHYKKSGLQKSPQIRPLSPEEANVMLSRWHYLGAVGFIIHAWGHEEGCCVFGRPRGRQYEKTHKDQGIDIIELIRMVGKPGHKWAMSSLMSQCMKALRNLNLYDKCVTYSDPVAGHNGMTYRAAGWIFDGEISPDERIYTIKEEAAQEPFFEDLAKEKVHPRTAFARYGTSSRTKVKELLGDRCELGEVTDEAKSRFYKLLKRQKPREQERKGLLA